MKSETRTLIALMAMAAILFLVNGGGYDLWPPDEPRYAEVAREMLESGDFLVPRINGTTYAEKPPLLFWMMAGAGLVLGELNEWAARLPSMIAGIYVVFLTFALGRRLFDARIAGLASFILITSLGFWIQARKGQIDMLLAAALLTTLYAFWRWDQERATRWLWVAYAGMAAGILAKGPPALVFPLLFLFAYYWKNPEGRKRTRWVVGTVAAILVALAWYIPARLAGAETAEEAIGAGIGGNLFRNTIGRFILGVSKAQAPWYYLETLPRDFLPWTLICPPLLYWAWKNRKSSEAMRFLHSWLVPAFIFFSICIGKRSLYLVPLFPVIAIVLAVAWVQVEASERFKWVKPGLLVWCLLLILIGFSPLALPFVPYTLQSPLHVWILALVAMVSGVAGLIVFRSRGARRAPYILGIQMAVLYVTVVYTAFPEIDHFKSARSICAPARQLAEAGTEFKLYSVGFSREEYIYYSRHSHEPVLTSLVGDIDPDNLMEQAKLQKEAKKIISRAVEDIPISDLANITPEEQETLSQAMAESVDSHEDSEAIRAFEEDLLAEVRAFIEDFGGETPALAFIQEEDWRWLVPLYIEDIPVKIVADRPVGSRHVLLLANESAAALLSL